MYIIHIKGNSRTPVCSIKIAGGKNLNVFLQNDKITIHVSGNKVTTLDWLESAVLELFHKIFSKTVLSCYMMYTTLHLHGLLWFIYFLVGT